MLKDVKEFNLKVVRGTIGSFYFSNEWNFSRTLRKLSEHPKISTDGIRVGVVTGEGFLLSILPELLDKIDVIVSNDIDARVRAHTRFLYNCLTHSNSIEEFKELYCDAKKNPLVEFKSISNLWNHFTAHKSDEILGKYHLLSSQERFLQCKSAAENLSWAWSNVDLLNSKECAEFKKILDEEKAVITLMNVSNVHCYDNQGTLPENLAHLFKNNPAPIILYSIGVRGPLARHDLCSKVVLSVQEYKKIYHYSPKREFKQSPIKKSLLKEMIAHFNKIVVSKLADDRIDTAFLPKLIDWGNRIEFILPKPYPALLSLQMELCHQIFSMLIPWHAKYMESSIFSFFLKPNSIFNRKIIVQEEDLSRVIADHQMVSVAPEVTEHTYTISKPAIGRWQLSIFSTPNILALEDEIEDLMRKYEQFNGYPQKALPVLEPLLKVISVYKTLPGAKSDIVEEEEFLLSEKGRVTSCASDIQAYYD